MKKAWDNPRECTMPAAARVPAELRLGPVLITPATVLAPMAGVTDSVFRRFIRSANATPEHASCGLLMTEFVSADGLARTRESKRQRYLGYHDDEHPIGAQLFGAHPETLAAAARVVEETGFDLVDLNMGCPAKRVVGSNGGSGLLRDLPCVNEIFRAVRQAVKIPFTVKLRLGWNDAEIVCLEVARMAEAEGLDGLTLHARTREQGYSGQARWEWIAKVKQTVKIPVIGNGDIRSPEDAAAMVAETGCDAVMIGRAALANPWIFRQIAEYTATGSYRQPTAEDRYHMIRAYFQMLLDEAEPGAVAGKMKQFATWFTHGVTGGARLRAAIYHSRTGAEVLAQVDAFFTSQLENHAEAVSETPEP